MLKCDRRFSLNHPSLGRYMAREIENSGRRSHLPATNTAILVFCSRVWLIPIVSYLRFMTEVSHDVFMV